MPELAFHRSGAGFYLGTWCMCGPYSRESGYYPTREAARGGARERRLRAALTLPTTRAGKTAP